MTGLDEAACHVEAHLAEPNEADIHVNPSLRLVASVCANLSRSRGAGPHRRGKPLEMPVRCAHHASRRRVQKWTVLPGIAAERAASKTPSERKR
jgi:hypothetical protein